MPEITTVPRICRAAAPDPEENHNGKQPAMNASDVINKGRRRKRVPSSAASKSPRPFSNSIFANSTIRIAFFAARPITTIRPICAYTQKPKPQNKIPKKAPKNAIATTKKPENGSDQLPKSAAKIKKTKTSDNASDLTAAPDVCFSW